MFTRIGSAAIKKDLHNTLIMCEALGNPHQKFKSIHIAGTNGKGSTSHMLAAILQKAGYKTGLYTSPHLKDFRERIRINGKMVSKSFVINFVEKHKELITTIEPSFFEVTVAMAFDYFAKEKVDIAIIEVGLGGRLDSTNIIRPEVSVITNISLDHTQILGDTLAEIAGEKAGIIKRNIPVVVGERHEETQQVFLAKAKAENSLINFAEDQYHIVNHQRKGEHLIVDIAVLDQLNYPDLTLDLTGTYQLKNVITVIQAIDILRKKGFNITDDSIYSALKQVKKLTGLQGRWQTLSKNPLVICDTGHNKAGIIEVLRNIDSIKHRQLHMVIGMVKDKDIDGVLKLLPEHAIYYFCEPQLERALSAKELQEKASKYHLKGYLTENPMEALALAREKAHPEDLIFIGGSTFVVSEIL